jgi:hypothetical protein
VKSTYDIGGIPDVSPTVMFVPKTVHSVVPPSRPVDGTLNSSCPVVGAVNATILEGALSSIRA